MTKRLEDIIEIIRKQKKILEDNYKVKAIGIFGSYVRGEQTTTSDVDILVEFEEEAKIGLLKYVNMENYLSDLLGVKVDLVTKSALKPRLGKQILKEVSYL